MTNLFRYGTTDDDTLLQVDLTANDTPTVIAAGATISDANISASASYGINGFNAADGATGGQGINVTFSTADATTLRDTGTVIFEVEQGLLDIAGQTHDDFLFTFGADVNNPDNHATPTLPCIYYRTTGTAGSGGDGWGLIADTSSDVSSIIHHVISGQNYSIPATVKCMWTWNTTKAHLWVNGLLEICVDRTQAAASVFEDFTIGGWAQAGFRGPAHGIRRVQVLKRHVAVPTSTTIDFVGLLGSSYLVANGQAVHPSYQEAGQDLYWADDAGTGFDDTTVGAADLVYSPATLTGFDHGFMVAATKRLGDLGIYPRFINRAQAGGTVAHATGVSSPASDSETLLDGHYLRLIADTVTAGGTVPDAIICDFGTNEIAGSVAPTTFERGYKSLIRKASADGVKLMVLHTVASMTLSGTYSATPNDDDVDALTLVIKSLPDWAKSVGLAIKLVIADTASGLGGYAPDTDLYNANDIHPNETGGDVQGSISASAFAAGVAAIGSKRGTRLIPRFM